MTDGAASTPIDRLEPTPPVLDLDTVAELYDTAGRRWLRVNCVSSLDGAATVSGVSAPLSFPLDHWLLLLLRAQCDALLVGAGTVRAEGYGPLRATGPGRDWRRAHDLPEHPTLVVVSGSLALDPDAPVFRQAPVRPIVLTAQAAPWQRRQALAPVAEIIDAGQERVELATAVAQLRARGLARLHCEGGPRLFGELIAADLVDEVCLTLSPMVVGGRAPRIAAGVAEAAHTMQLQHVVRVGDALLLRYHRAR